MREAHAGATSASIDGCALEGSCPSGVGERALRAALPAHPPSMAAGLRPAPPFRGGSAPTPHCCTPRSLEGWFLPPLPWRERVGVRGTATHPEGSESAEGARRHEGVPAPVPVIPAKAGIQREPRSLLAPRPPGKSPRKRNDRSSWRAAAGAPAHPNPLPQERGQERARTSRGGSSVGGVSPHKARLSSKERGPDRCANLARRAAAGAPRGYASIWGGPKVTPGSAVCSVARRSANAASSSTGVEAASRGSGGRSDIGVQEVQPA